MQRLSAAVKRKAGKMGLRMNVGKCNIMVSSYWEDRTAVSVSDCQGI